MLLHFYFTLKLNKVCRHDSSLLRFHKTYPQQNDDIPSTILQTLKVKSSRYYLQYVEIEIKS